MINRILKFIKKQFLLVWILFVAVTLMSISTYAIYESKFSTMNRVVVASSTEGLMFSSNILEAEEDTVYRAIYRPELPSESKATGSYDVELFLYN